MIRMGRTQKPENPNQPLESTNFEAAKSNQPFGYNTQTSEAPPFRQNTSENSLQAQNRAYSDSESMARDIKEGRLSGYVGSGTMLTGETNFKSMLRVDGHLTGKVGSEGGTLVVGATGQVDANVAVAAAVINGTVNGDIVATERIELGRTAKVVGNVQTPSLMMEQGAILEGNCNMTQARAEFNKRSKAQTEQIEKAKFDAIHKNDEKSPEPQTLAQSELTNKVVV